MIIDRICAASSSGVVIPLLDTTSRTVIRGSLSRERVTATMTAVCAPDSFPWSMPIAICASPVGASSRTIVVASNWTNTRPSVYPASHSPWMRWARSIGSTWASSFWMSSARSNGRPPMGVVASTVSGVWMSSTSPDCTSARSQPSGSPIGVSVMAMRPRWRRTRAASSLQMASGGGSSMRT